MNNSFDEVIDRKSSYSLKWDVKENELPMWVADMDFAVAPPILEALKKRLENRVFGYNIIPDEWAESYCNWWMRRHDFKIDPEWLIFTTGVVPAISTAVRRLTLPAENVLVQTPCYNIFFNSIRNNGRNIIESPLLEKDGEYEMDFALLEEQLKNPQTSLMILCNPQNPTGKIWEKETLARLGELCKKYHVTVLSDEIHCDIADPGFSYTSFASVSDTCKDISVTCMAPTKAFNIAGLQTAAVMVPNELLRHKMWRGLNTDEVAEPNTFAMDAAIAAFNHGEEWLTEMCAYVADNKKILRDFLQEKFPEITLSPCKATYLMWLDVRELCKKGAPQNADGVSVENTSADDGAENLCNFIRKHSGLYLSEGGQYGKGFEGFIRWNVACPKSVLKDGLKRFEESILAYKAL